MQEQEQVASFRQLDALTSMIQAQFERYLIRMQAIQYDLYFLAHAHIDYSDIFRHLWNEESSHNLIQAFANKGTTKGLIYILRAIFGSDVTIHMSIDNPNEIGLEISNTTHQAMIGLAFSSEVMYALSEELVLALLDLRNIELHSIQSLIIDFLPAGIKLNKLNIN